PTVTTIVISTAPREPRTKRCVIGTSKNSTSCLESTKLTRGSGENAAETSVAPAYARSIQKKRGASNASCREMIRAIQQRTASASRLWASAMENWSAAATPKSVTRPACSSQSPAARSGGAELRACALDMNGSLPILPCFGDDETLGSFNDLLWLNPGQA